MGEVEGVDWVRLKSAELSDGCGEAQYSQLSVDGSRGCVLGCTLTALSDWFSVECELQSGDCTIPYLRPPVYF